MKGPVLDPSDRKFSPGHAPGDPRLIEAVSDHVEKHIGEIRWVMHEPVSERIHLDLFWVPPGPGREFHTFVTCGMSERPMSPPDGYDDCRHAELLIRLPPDWKLGHRALRDARNHWPLVELEQLVRIPHLHDTWIWAYHSVSNGLPPQLLPGSDRFSGCILAPPTWSSPGFRSLAVESDRSIRFFGVIPLYADELLLARESGPETLMDRIEQAGVTDLLDVARPCVAAGLH